MSKSIVTSTNPNPGMDARSYASVTIDGKTRQCTYCDEFDSKEFKENMAALNGLGDRIRNQVYRDLGVARRNP